MTPRISRTILAVSGLAGVCTLAALVPATGCTVLTNDALPDDAGPFEGGAEAGTSACTQCVTQECEGQWSVCLLDGTCQGMHACASAPSANVKACVCGVASNATDGGANPRAAYAAFASCNDARTCTKCASDCVARCATDAGSTTATCDSVDAGVDAAIDASADAASDAGDASVQDAAVDDAASDAATPPSVDGCTSCVAAKCGDPKKACALGTECASFLACAFTCSTASCAEDCGRRFASGRELAVELSNCTLAGCRGSCGL